MLMEIRGEEDQKPMGDLMASDLRKAGVIENPNSW